MEKYPKLVNERERFPHPRKPSPTDLYTPLHRAAEAGRADTVTLLLLNGADVNADSAFGWTAAHLAARAGHLDVVKILVEHRADTAAQTVARPEKVEIPPSSPPGAEPVRFPAIPAMTPLDVAVEFKRGGVANYLRSVKK
ncbi:MAG: ankyrin repeat protein [Gemmataceae bacterium]|nr:ankyrin repeat protein [Gemmataceae bacterium]